MTWATAAWAGTPSLERSSRWRSYCWTTTVCPRFLSVSACLKTCRCWGWITTTSGEFFNSSKVRIRAPRKKVFFSVLLMFSNALLAGWWSSGLCAIRRIRIPPWLLSTWKIICYRWRRSHPKPSLVWLTLRDSSSIRSRSNAPSWWPNLLCGNFQRYCLGCGLHRSSREKHNSVQSARSFHRPHSSLLQSLFLNSSVDCNGSGNLKYAWIC